MWVVDPDGPNIQTYHYPASSAGGTTLSALTVSDGTNSLGLRPAYGLGETNYRTSVTATVERVTVTATPSDNTSALAYLDADGKELEDADAGAAGHQVDVVEGTTIVRILVTATDGTAVVRTLGVEKDTLSFGGRTPSKDVYSLDLDDNTHTNDIWSDGTTMWVSDGLGALYAYSMATGKRDETKEFALHGVNPYPRGIWSDGTTMWVMQLDTPTDRVYAYSLVGGVRQDGTSGTTDMDITLPIKFNYPRGMWSDGTTLYIVEGNVTGGRDEAYAFSMSDGTRQDGTGGTTDKEIELDIDHADGVWSDDTTLWVSSGDNIYAYTLATRVRDKTKEVSHIFTQSRGIWSDGTTLWVADESYRVHGIESHWHRVFSYRLPPVAPTATTLMSLTAVPSPAVASFSPTLRPAFAYATDQYRVAVPNETARMTIDATPHDDAATVSYLDAKGQALADADASTAGDQVAVATGPTVIQARVAKTGAATSSYRVTVERDSAVFGGWTPTKDFNTLLDDNSALEGATIIGAWGNPQSTERMSEAAC